MFMRLSTLNNTVLQGCHTTDKPSKLLLVDQLSATKQLPAGATDTSTAFRHTEERRWKPVPGMDQKNSKC